MILTLISLVVLGVVLRGLYFFSAGGFSAMGVDVLQEEKAHCQLKEEGALERSPSVSGAYISCSSLDTNCILCLSNDRPCCCYLSNL